MDRFLYQRIVNEYGTPVYVLDEAELEHSLVQFENAFTDFPAEVRIAYPYKTNSLKRLCQHMHSQGMWAEVSSGLEMQMALRLRVEPRHIIFNSPHKSHDDLVTALQAGCQVHVDNMEEFGRILSVQQAVGAEARIGVRVSPISSDLFSKFGFMLENEAYAALEQIAQTPNVRVVGLHTHRSSIPCLEEYEKHVSPTIDFAAKVIRDRLVDLEYVDIGSGFTVSYPQPLRISTWTVPSMSEYVEVLCTIWKRASLPADVYLVVEPGKRLVASCVTLLTTVASIKERPSGRICFVDGGHNLMPGVDWCRHPIVQLKPVDSSMSEERYDVHGCLCDSLDVLQTDVPLFSLEAGEVLCIGSVGGYDMSRSFSWQIPRSPVIWVSKNSEYEVVRAKEDVDYLWRLCS